MNRISLFLSDHQRIIEKVIYFLLFIIYLLLSFKQPFSTRTLIPNLEPFPDTLYYAIPALRFAEGDGFTLSAYGHSIKSMVPPLYSVVLIPLYVLYPDVRMFYVTNLILGCGTLALILWTIKKSTTSTDKKFLTIGVVGFLYVSTFYIYNLPSLLMAENITLFLASVSFYLLFSSITKEKVVLSGYLGLLLLLIKFANFPIAVAFHLLYLWKMWQSKSVQLGLYHLISLCTAAVLFATYIIQTRVFVQHVNLSEGSSFSLSYVTQQLPIYFKALLGGQTIYLWYQEYFLSPVVSLLGMIGFLFSLLIKRYRQFGFVLWTMSVSTIGFMSTFYYADVRYIFVVLFCLLLGSAITIDVMMQRLSLLLSISCILLLLSVELFLVHPAPHLQQAKIISLKNQVVLNLKYAETPWNYLAVEHLNQHVNNPEAYVGTFLPPFYVSIFSDERYHYLPMISTQEFSATGKNILQYFYTGDLMDYYHQLLDEGKEVYITNAYANNTIHWQNQFKKFHEEFTLTQISEGCFSTCNIYRVSRKQ